jgi:two-component system sensor histidine kinase HydH
MNPSDEYEKKLKSLQDDIQRILRIAQEDSARILRIAQDDIQKLVDSNEPKTPEVQQQQEPSIKENDVLKKDKLHTIGEMSSRLAHDLQNPLSIIKNTLEILKIKQPRLDEKTKENYERIERAATRMSQQIKDVLDYVRTSNLVLENASLIGLLKSVIADMEISEGIKITLPTEDVLVYGDIKQLEIVFANMIANSIQAIDEKGKIMIQASEIDGLTVIDVIDNGRGIPKENLNRIFEPLFTTKQNGTGLGLASCKSIIENHGGSIECSSIVGKGTVFTIKIPSSPPTAIT